MNPLKDESNPSLGGCSVFSIFEYWASDMERINRNHTYYPDRSNKTHSQTTTYKDHLLYCLKTPSAIADKYTSSEPCLASSGVMVSSFLAIGGESEHLTEGEALIITLVLNNYVDRQSEEFLLAEQWEGAMLDLLKNTDLEHWNLAFYSERSIEDELAEAAESDVVIFIIAYSAIFIYLAIALGEYTSVKTIPFETKFTLAFGSILIIFSAALGSIGLFGWMGVESNMIVMEVIPFLLLAIGGDNIFLLMKDVHCNWSET